MTAKGDSRGRTGWHTRCDEDPEHRTVLVEVRAPYGIGLSHHKASIRGDRTRGQAEQPAHGILRRTGARKTRPDEIERIVSGVNRDIGPGLEADRFFRTPEEFRGLLAAHIGSQGTWLLDMREAAARLRNPDQPFDVVAERVPAGRLRIVPRRVVRHPAAFSATGEHRSIPCDASDLSATRAKSAIPCRPYRCPATKLPAHGIRRRRSGAARERRGQCGGHGLLGLGLGRVRGRSARERRRILNHDRRGVGGGKRRGRGA